MGAGPGAASGQEQYVSEERRIVAERLEEGGLTICARLPGDDPRVLRGEIADLLLRVFASAAAGADGCGS